MSLEQKFSYGDIQKYIYICVQTASRMSFLGVKKWYSANVFLATNRNMFAGKFAKPERRLTSRKFENLMMFTGSCGQI